jgi:uncharacterized protein (DUF433 family)
MANYITAKASVMSGAPCIAGTRIPLSRIIFLLKEGHTVYSIHQGYPHVPTKILNGAINELILGLDSGNYEILSA